MLKLHIGRNGRGRDHDRGQVVWAARGRGADALAGLFEHLGEDGCAAIESVTMDMARGYEKAIREHLPHARIICDRFHVPRLAGNAIDAVRRAEIRGAEDPSAVLGDQAQRYALLKSPWSLNWRAHDKLADVQAKTTNASTALGYSTIRWPMLSRTVSRSEPARRSMNSSARSVAPSSSSLYAFRARSLSTLTES